ncbi:MAG: hypothetical protein ACLQU2_18295 [Candidatus Binataceae bacterium]
MSKIPPAERYAAAADLQVITCFFNPARYRTKRENYERFMAPLRAGGVPTLTVECAFGADEFELPAGPEVLRVRGDSVMFQKERLLNLALPHLLPSCTKVAWLDADVLFERADWLAAASEALNEDVVIQPFERCYRLPRGSLAYDGCGRSWDSFAAAYGRSPGLFTTGRYTEHGHVGFAWAARRSLLDKVGLRDADPSGHSDHLMAHAMLGDWNTICFRRLVGVAGPYAESTRRWARRFHNEVQGRLGYVPGALLHLWHGRIADRRYYTLALRLRAFGFDPGQHLRLDGTGLWVWTDAAAEMNDEYARYFAGRREDA